MSIGLGEQRSLLGTLPDATFVRRYRQSFGRPRGAGAGRAASVAGTRVRRAPPVYDQTMLRRLRIENLVLIREADLELGPGLNVLSGETGAGKTIFAQAIGLLLGVKGDAGAVGPPASEAYVEAELDVPEEFFDEGELASLAELRPEDEPGLVLARRVFADGRTRAYAWGRAIAREDLAAATERLIAMSGQFEQRRLARPAYQLDVLDAFVGAEQAQRRRDARDAWRALGAARRRNEEISRDAGAAALRLEGLRELVERTEGLERGEEDALRAERERMRHAAELAEGAARATAAVSPDDGDGAASLAAAAERALEPLTRIAPELEGPTAELRELAVRLSEVGSDLHRFVASLDADPARIEEVESRLDLIADAAAPIRRADAGGAARSPRRGRRRARRARRRARPRRRGRGRAGGGRGSGSRQRPPHCGPRGTRRRSRSPPPWPRTSRASAWARVSSGSSCESASPARPGATRSRS